MTNSFAAKTIRPFPTLAVVSSATDPPALMKSHEIFQHMSPALAVEILSYLQKERTPVFKSVVSGLAGQRNLRAVFVERKPPDERYAWIKTALSRKAGRHLGGPLASGLAPRRAKTDALRFLDSLGIAHDEDGTVENLPDSPAKEKLRESIDQLLANTPPRRSRSICTPSTTWIAR